jgi:hypothetical protein
VPEHVLEGDVAVHQRVRGEGHERRGEPHEGGCNDIS